MERSQREVLLDIVRGARRRLRVRQLLYGASIVAAAMLVCAVVAAYGVDHFRLTPAAVWIARGLVVVLPLLLAVRFLGRPLLQRVSDMQLALYLEEHAPQLDARLVSAIECAARGEQSRHSQALEHRLVAEALEHSGRVDHGRWIERQAMTRSGGVLAGTVAVGAALLLLGPLAVRRGVAGFMPWGRAHNPYGIGVSPRDTVVARGSDLKVTATLENFTADRVEIAVRRGAGEWLRFPMVADSESGRQSIVLFKLNQGTDYFVDAGGVRSAVAHVGVADLPHVSRIDLEYHFPAYTGLPVQRVDDGGDIAALAGTRVHLKITPTIAPAGAALVVGGRDTVVLAPQPGGVLAGDLTVTKASSYRVVFRTKTIGTIAGSGEYAIDALKDQPPTVRFRTPAHDLQVTSVEEVFTEAEAHDDYGVARLDLAYRVNGGDEQVVSLGPGVGSHKEVVGSHTFELEDLGLKPGDLIAYYARAREADHGGGAQQATSDIYFLQVRPFERDYKAADAQPGGGQSGASSPGALSQREREIVAGTFNVLRDSARAGEREQRENLATLALAQGKLREDVATLSSRIRGRGIIGMDSTFAVVAEALDSAFVHMQEAERRLGERNPRAALPAEQQTLQQLQRAEAAFKETQVARGNGQSAGGGGEQQQSPEDLADLFDLQMDKLKNQYEQVQRGERQQADNQLDEAMEKLKELARRQQQENERLRARQQEQAAGAGAGGTSSGQRDLAQQTEEMARQLERLSREQNRQDLSEAAARLRDAANAMRQAGAQGLANGAARGREALDRLREAQRQLEQDRNDRLKRNVDDALRRAEQLAEQQNKVKQMVDRLEPGSQDAAQQIAQLDQRKIAMARQAGQLQNDIDSLSRESARDQPDASRKLGAAADGMRDAKLHDKILYSRGVIRGDSKEYAKNFEQQIGSDIDTLRQQLANARDAIGETKGQRIARALDQADNLVSGLESMQERLKAREGQQAQAPQQGQQGQGQQGERGQAAQQGQQGQSGQQGQADQRGQPGQQRQPGQQGQPGEERQPGEPGQVTGGVPRLSGDRRQLQSELRQRVGDAERLRGALQQEGVDVSDLGRAIDRLRQLEAPLLRGDSKAIASLGSQVVEGLKEYEFALRRQFVQADEQRPFGTGADQVPERYRKLVEEYYKALAGKKP
jgi:hypothetical protein